MNGRAEPIDGDGVGDDACPYVRVVVLNFNGGERVLRCLEHLGALDWPRNCYEVVVVDNDSHDQSVQHIGEQHPWVRIVRNRVNTGFPANNLALEDLTGVDYVALCNDDAYVEPNWLRALVDVLEADPALGAGCPKMLFAAHFADVQIQSPTANPGGGDPRALGLRIAGLRVDGDDRWAAAQFPSGFHDLEWDTSGSFRWTGSEATLRVPLPSITEPVEVVRVELLVSALEPGTASFVGARDAEEHQVGLDPFWVELDVAGPGYDVINNAGSVVHLDGHGADRGFGEPDDGSFADPVDVFAWCGGSVLLRRTYLDDVGLFAPEFFLYYEDTDLSWRGQARGWRYRYVPEAVVRHEHSASSGVASAKFFHFTERNRLLLALRNAPARIAFTEVASYVRATFEVLGREVGGPLRRKRIPWPIVSIRRARVLAGLVLLVPVALRGRRGLRSARAGRPDAVFERLRCFADQVR